MYKVKNKNNKTVCCINKAHKIVEIINKGRKTTIYFLNDGTVKIINE